MQWLLCCLASIFGVQCERRSPPWGTEPRFPPRVPRTTRPVLSQVLVFLDDLAGIDIETATEAQILAKLRETAEWQALERATGPVSLQRAITLDPTRLNRLVGDAGKNAERYRMQGYRPRFRNYFYVVPQRASTKPEDVYCAAKGNRNVRFAQFVAPLRNASSRNFLLPPANRGVNAMSAAGTGIVGSVDVSDVALIDIEKAWPALLPGGLISLSTPRMESGQLDDIGHGAATYGAAVAPEDLALDVRGVAPGAKFFRCPYLSAANPNQTPMAFLASAILGTIDFIKAEAAAGRLGTAKGHVILIEQETDQGYPVEVESAVHDAIRTATLNDLIVVEPAGNGWSDLAGVAGQALINGVVVVRQLDGQDDSLRSGAILVAAGHSGEPPFNAFGERHDFSNFGNVIDCWAWGDSTRTYTATIVGPNVVVRDSVEGYIGTSGAAAIVGGVVVAMQGLQIKAGAARLTELQARPMLRTIGTPGKGDLLGKVMPDLGGVAPKPGVPPIG